MSIGILVKVMYLLMCQKDDTKRVVGCSILCLLGCGSANFPLSDDFYRQLFVEFCLLTACLLFSFTHASLLYVYLLPVFSFCCVPVTKHLAVNFNPVPCLVEFFTIPEIL